MAVCGLLQKSADIDETQITCIVQLLQSPLTLARFAGSFCLKDIFRKRIINQQFKKQIQESEDFARIIVTMTFAEKSLPVKIELTEALLDIVKQFGEELLDKMVD